MNSAGDKFSTETVGLAVAQATELVELSEGDEFELRISPVVKDVNGAMLRMLAYNGSIPGPTLKVTQGSEVVVNIENHDDTDTTVHWHGLRLENRYDGTHETQAPIPPGGRFSARLAFPDPGVYWYHPHIRTDYGLEMGLYGAILVEPAEPNYWPAVDREVVLTLDDLLLEDGKVAPFSRTTPTHTAMGRFGNVLLTNGVTNLALTARQGETVRFYLINTANTRVFKAALPGVRMKLVGGDSGHVEREEFVDDVVVAPSERAVVDALFDTPGNVVLEHRTPHRVYPLASIHVTGQQVNPSRVEQFEVLRTNADLEAERRRLAEYLHARPDKILAFIAEMNLADPNMEGPVVYACPMHPEVVGDSPGHCPKCGMKLMPTSLATPPSHGDHHKGSEAHHKSQHEHPENPPASAGAGATDRAALYSCPMHPDIVSETPGQCPMCGMHLVLVDGAGVETHADHGHRSTPDEHDHAQPGDPSFDSIEWEDDMVELNRITTMENMSWKLIDRETGAENAAIDWHFKVGDKVKIRLMNEFAGDHPMHHPFHVHGASRFLVLARDGVMTPNLVWKDTVLVRTGETVDLLLDVTHPGVWMAHCHIAEHHENGMMLTFEVVSNGDDDTGGIASDPENLSTSKDTLRNKRGLQSGAPAPDSAVMRRRSHRSADHPEQGATPC